MLARSTCSTRPRDSASSPDAPEEAGARVPASLPSQRPDALSSERLSPGSWGRLPDQVRRPSYERATLPAGIVHLAAGAFHRAHQAVYTELALAQAFGPWGILQSMMAEAAPTLHVSSDLDAYRAALSARFANPALAHRTSQIAMNGSQKLPQRLQGAIRDGLRAGAPINHLCLAVAAWIRYAIGRDEQGRAIAVAEPLAHRFATIGAAAGSDPAALVRGFLKVGEVFGTDLPREERFTAAIIGWLGSLLSRGARATVAECVRDYLPETPRTRPSHFSRWHN